MYQFVSKDGERYKNCVVHENVLEVLEDAKCIVKSKFDMTGKKHICFGLTVKGFEFAHDKVKSCRLKTS